MKVVNFGRIVRSGIGSVRLLRPMVLAPARISSTLPTPAACLVHRCLRSCTTQRTSFQAFGGDTPVQIDRKQMTSCIGHLAWLRKFARTHRKWLIRGTVAAVGVVGLRLLLPWPLKVMITPWLVEQANQAESSLGPMLDVRQAVFWGGAFLVAAVGLGVMDLMARLAFARFAIGTVRDLRAAAFEAATTNIRRDRKKNTGDLIARLVGDTARIKTGLKGFLIHVATNSVQFVGMTCVLLWIYPPLGLVFAAGGAVLVAVTIIGAMRMYQRASRYRRKEGKIAEVIREASESDSASVFFTKINRSSGEHEAALTRIQGLTTCAAHAIFGVVVLATFWIGTLAAISGSVDPANLVVLAMYGLMARTPIVQLARQGSRTGKIFACLQRVVEPLEACKDQHLGVPVVPEALSKQLALINIRAHTGREQGRRRRLSVAKLEICAGERIAIVGKPSSGKTSLLELLAGILRQKRGQILWDGCELSSEVAALLSSGPVHYVAEYSSWTRTRLRNLIGFPAEPICEHEQRTLLKACGLTSLCDALPNGLGSKLSSANVSTSQRKALAVVRALQSDASILLLDNPTAGLSRKRATKLLRAVLFAKPEATLLVSFNGGFDVELFDRVIELRSGRVIYDGRADLWYDPSTENGAMLVDNEPTVSTARRSEGRLEWTKQ